MTDFEQNYIQRIEVIAMFTAIREQVQNNNKDRALELIEDFLNVLHHIPISNTK